MNSLAYISWDVAPEILTSPITLLYYSLFFAISFLLGFYIMKKMMVNEGAPEKWMDLIFFYVFVATIVGARLGHVFFYEPEYYLSHPIEIFKIWEGGLASHGAAIAVIIALWIYARRVTKKSFFYGADKVVVTIAIAAAFIRLGNLANSEIIGERSTASSALFFEHSAKKNITKIIENQIGIEQQFSIYAITFEPTEQHIDTLGFEYPLATLRVVLAPLQKNDQTLSHANWVANSLSELTHKNILSTEQHYFSTLRPPLVYESGNYIIADIPSGIIPRFPTQIWESAAYFVLFILLFFGYWKKQWYKRDGLLFGIFLTFLFGARFIIEFWKEEQTDITGDSSLTMGQWLSVPAVLLGVFFIIRALKKPPFPDSYYEFTDTDKTLKNNKNEKK